MSDPQRSAGVPADTGDPAAAHWDSGRLCAWFAAEGMACERLDHPPVFTAE